jgi:hypothetical protein
MSSLLVRPAHEGDNQQLLKLTRDCPLLGPISFYQEREPRFFTFNELQGESYEVYVVEFQGEIVGSVSCVLRWVYLNGQEVPVWYVGDLKIAPRMRGKGILREFITQVSRLLFEKGTGVDLGLSLIVKTNPASRALTGGRPYMPHFIPLGTVRNYAVHLLFSKRIKDDYQVTRATGEDIEAMTALLKSVYVQKQFAPAIEPAAFFKKVEQIPGLGLNQFCLAKQKGKILGLVGVWDQQSFKKIKILSFSPKIRLSRTFYNLLTRPLGARPIPPPGSFLPYFYLTHLAIEGDDPIVLRALLNRIHNDHLRSPYLFFTVGLLEGSPLENALRGFFYHTFEALAFAVMPRGSRWKELDFHERPLYIDTSLT